MGEHEEQGGKRSAFSKHTVIKLLKDYYTIEERKYHRGDFESVIILEDLKRAIKQADLGNRQTQIVELWKQGYNRAEIARSLGLAPSTVKESIDSAATKIATVYQNWGYSNEY